MIKNFRTYDLAVTFYRLSQTLSVQSFLQDQLNRAASSIVLNLAEGRGKPTAKDQVRFYSIAMGSFRECEAILQLENIADSEVAECADKLGAHLYRLIQNAR